MKRGIVPIKPVFVSISHYRKVYGSVCSADVQATPPIPAQTDAELHPRGRELVSNFDKQMDVDFVQMEQPLVIKEHGDLRRLPAELTYDTDALLVGTHGVTPLILRTLS